jgi:tetratricopeptide (TPR) repeat protein
MIDELVEFFRKKEVMIFAGAGISRPSGLPLAREFKVNLIEALCSDSENILRDFYERNEDELKEAIDSIMMERMMQILKDNIGEASLYVLNIYKNGEYNSLHSSIAKLCDLGYLSVIFTTNFDCLLEDAMKEINFKKCCSDSEFSVFESVTLYKLHGSIDNEKTLIAILDQVGRGLSRQKTEILKNCLDKNSCIFIGWSNDDVDITPILFHGEKKFFWVKHSEIDEIRFTDYRNLRNEAKEEKRINSLIIAHKGYKIECNTTNLLESILSRLSDETIDRSSNPAEIDYSDVFRDLSEGLPDSFKFNIVGELCRDIGKWEDSIAFYQIALRLAEEDINRLLMSLFHNNLGVAYQAKGEWDKSISHFEKSLELKNNLGERLELKKKRGYEDIFISTLSNLGISYLRSGDLNKAADYLNKGAELAKESRNTYLIGRTLNNLGILHDHKGDTRKAIEYYEESLREKRKSGDISGIASSLSNLARKYELQGNRSKSIDYHVESIDLKKKLGDLQGIAQISNNLASMFVSRLDFERALEYCNEALGKFEHLGDTVGIASIYNTMGELHCKTQEWDKAFFYYSQSLEIAKKIDNKLGISVNLNSLSIIMRLKGNLENSMRYAKESLALAMQLDYSRGVAYALDNIGNIYQEIAHVKDFTKRGLIHRIPIELEMATKWHQKALIMHKELGDLEGILAALTNLGIAYKNSLCFEEALNCYKEGVETAKKLNDTESLARILNNIGTVYDMKSDIRIYDTEECSRKAMHYYTQSLEIKKRLGNQADIAITTFNIGSIYCKRGEYIKGLKIFEKDLPIFENSGNKQSAMITCEYISRVYEHLNNPKLSQMYYRKYLRLRKQLKRVSEV